MNSPGEKIRHYRLKRGLSQGDLALKIGMRKTRTVGSIVSHWERDSKIPSLESLKKLAAALKISVSKLI